MEKDSGIKAHDWQLNTNPPQDISKGRIAYLIDCLRCKDIQTQMFGLMGCWINGLSDRWFDPTEEKGKNN